MLAAVVAVDSPPPVAVSGLLATVLLLVWLAEPPLWLRTRLPYLGGGCFFVVVVLGRLIREGVGRVGGGLVVVVVVRSGG